MVEVVMQVVSIQSKQSRWIKPDNTTLSPRLSDWRLWQVEDQI